MRFDFTVLALVAFIAPSVIAKTWDVNVVGGKFSPAELDIAPGDTVNWPNNDGADHAIVETQPGVRSCNNKPGGFNSGRKTKGQAYRRTFPVQAVINYKDGMGANCANGATGTIYVGARPSNDPNAGKTTTGATGATGTTMSPTRTSGPVATNTPAPTQTPGAANNLASGNAFFLGAVCVIGALFGL